MLRFSNPALCQPFCLADEGAVKGDELCATLACGKMQGIGEIKAVFVPFDCPVHELWISNIYIGQAKKLLEGRGNSIRLKAIGKTEDPFGFKEHRIRNINSFIAEYLPGLGILGLVVAGEEADKDVGINRYH